MPISATSTYSSAVCERSESPGPIFTEGKRQSAWFESVGDPTRGITPYKFTENICKAQTFAYRFAVEEEMKRENKYLEAEKHPLAGHLFIAEIFTRPIIEPKEG